MRLAVPLAILGSVGAISVVLVGGNMMAAKDEVEMLKIRSKSAQSSVQLDETLKRIEARGR